MGEAVAGQHLADLTGGDESREPSSEVKLPLKGKMHVAIAEAGCYRQAMQSIISVFSLN